MLLREIDGRNPQPSATIFDGRTLQSTVESGARAGYDGHKKCKGSKVYLAVDTLGQLLAVIVTPTNEQERAQVAELAELVQVATGDSVEVAFVDQGFTACNDGTKAGARDAAMFAVAYGAGLRRAEIAKLTLADYNEPVAKITVRKGKRNKTRTIPLPAGTIDALARWIALRGTEPGALFPTIDKKDRIDPNLVNFTAQSVQLAFDKRAEKAKVRKFTPHDLRRTYISNLLDSSGDLTAVQKLAGHANTNTTGRYDRRGERAKQAAVRTLHVPYQPPD